MDWDIDLSKRFRARQAQKQPLLNPDSIRFRRLSTRLLFSYLAAMAAVVGILSLAVYQLFAQSLYRKVDQNLDLLGSAAIHSLPELLSHEMTIEPNAGRVFDSDGDLDLPWALLHD
jgi:hypothetical protein